MIIAYDKKKWLALQRRLCVAASMIGTYRLSIEMELLDTELPMHSRRTESMAKFADQTIILASGYMRDLRAEFNKEEVDPDEQDELDTNAAIRMLMNPERSEPCPPKSKVSKKPKS